MGLYQDPQTYSSSRSRDGVPSSDLHRQYTADGRVEGDGTRTRLSPNILTPVPRVHHKQGEDSDATNPNNRVSGFHRKHSIDGAESPTEEDLGRVTEASRGGAYIRSCPLQADWQDGCCQPSYPIDTSVLQMPTDGSDRGLEEGGPELRYSPSSIRGQQGGVSLVGHSDGPLEWEDHPNKGCRADHRVRHFNPGLGSDMPRH